MAESQPAETTEQPARKGRLKLLVIVGGIMALEGVGFGAFIMLTGGPPASAVASIDKGHEGASEHGGGAEHGEAAKHGESAEHDGGGGHGGAKEASHGDATAPTVEILLVQGLFQNMSTNRLWRWHVEAYMKVRAENEAYVQQVLEQRNAEVQAGIAYIFRSAEHAHLREPDLTTLTHRLTAFTHEIFGDDAEGEPRVESVLITTINGLPIDG